MPEVEVELAERLAERLDARPGIGGAEVVGWRFVLGGGWTLRAGLKAGRLGGPYEAPAAARGSGGGVYLRWSDGQCSHGSLDSRSPDDLGDRLVEWRANAYSDPDAPEILPPAPLPKVRTADPAVEAIVDGEPTLLIAWLERARLRLARDGMARVDAASSVARSWRFVFNSHGLRAAYPETSASLYLAAEELYARSFARRRLPTESELGDLLDDVAATTPVLGRPTTPPLGEVPVLLAPGLAAAFVATFVVANLNGAGVYTGRSAFSLEDFRRGRQVMRQDLSLAIDTLLDLERAASPVSAEGVPGGRATPVQAGRLVRPIVDLKYARRCAFPPTPVPGGSPAFLLRGAEPLRSAEQVRSQLQRGLQLHSVLGLHAQDAASGRYSLVAPHVQVIRGGRSVGRAKVSLSGSFFEHLLDPRTELVAFPWGLNPGLLIWTTVEPQA